MLHCVKKNIVQRTKKIPTIAPTAPVRRAGAGRAGVGRAAKKEILMRLGLC